MTYNQVVKMILDLLDNHPNINEVDFTTPVNWINRNYVPSFPVANFTIDAGTFQSNREQSYRIDMWFLDKSGNEGEFETDVVSDMHGVAYDIIAQLKKLSNPYTVTDVITWGVISEKFEDYLSGIKLTLDLFVDRKYGACDVPTI